MKKTANAIRMFPTNKRMYFMDKYIGIIGGSGLGNLLAAHITDSHLLAIDTPFGKPSAPLLAGKIGSNNVLFLNRHGDGHLLSPSKIPYAANIFAMKKAGVSIIIATGAVGSLSENIHPGQLVLVDQFIDKTFRRQSSFFDNVAAVHCEFANPTCDRLRTKLSDASQKLKIDIHDKGTYICMEGPQFSTKAESMMHRACGGDLIGMTAMPEAKLAREAQMCYLLIAMPSDYDCWKPVAEDADKKSLLAEIIGNLNKCSENAIALIKEALGNNGGFCDDSCCCRKSLELAVWSDKTKIKQHRLGKLGVLFE